MPDDIRRLVQFTVILNRTDLHVMDESRREKKPLVLAANRFTSSELALAPCCKIARKTSSDFKKKKKTIPAWVANNMVNLR